jgi:hypothetical protein
MSWRQYGRQPEITRAAFGGHGIKCLRAYLDPGGKQIVENAIELGGVIGSLVQFVAQGGLVIDGIGVVQLLELHLAQVDADLVFQGRKGIDALPDPVE